MQNIRNQKSKKSVLNVSAFGLIFGLLAVGLGGCASGNFAKNGLINGVKPVQAPKIDIDNFRDIPPPSGANSQQWWQNFSDETLNKLVKDAESENIGVLIANSRLKEARAQGRATIAGFAPRINATASADYNGVTKGPKLVNAETGGAENNQSSQTSILGASWELPLFGRFANSLSGAKANVEGAKIGIEAAKIALVADIAAAYIDLRSAQTRLSYLEDDLAQAITLNAISQDRLRVGLISQSDASFAQTSLSAIEAQIPDAKLLVRMGLNRVAILRGLSPGALDETLAPIKNFEFRKNVPQITQIPADFVRRRLDVRQAEQNAILMSAGVGVAKADLYPRVTITGALTLLSALSGGPVAETIGRSNLNPSISLPLFDFGQRRASVKLADARFEQALLNYKATTLNAIAEGQQALSSYDFARDRLIAAQNGETAAITRLNAARQSFKVGLIAVKERVEAERDFAQARNARLSAQAAYSDAAIGLYRAFAGSPQII